jgi:hypothetical protein
MNMRGFQRRYACCGEEKNVALPGIEIRVPGHPAVTVVTKLADLSFLVYASQFLRVFQMYQKHAGEEFEFAFVLYARMTVMHAQ